MGHPDFRVRNKIFASLSENGLRAAAKIDPVNLDALVAADPATFRDAWGGRWVGIDLSRVSRTMLRDLLRDAGRMPILSSAISMITVDSQKKFSNPGVS